MSAPELNADERAEVARFGIHEHPGGLPAVRIDERRCVVLREHAEREAVVALAPEIPTLYLDRATDAYYVAEAVIGSSWLREHDARVIEAAANLIRYSHTLTPDEQLRALAATIREGRA